MAYTSTMDYGYAAYLATQQKKKPPQVGAGVAGMGAAIANDTGNKSGSSGAPGTSPLAPTTETLTGEKQEDTLGGDGGTGGDGGDGGGEGGGKGDDEGLGDQLNHLYSAREQAIIEALKTAAAESGSSRTKTFNKAMSDLDATQAGIAGRFYDDRNKAAAQSDVASMNFAQYMASQGVQGAAAGLPEAWRNMALQGVIGANKRAESQENAAIDRSRSQLTSEFDLDMTSLENKLRSDIAMAGFEIDAEKTAQIINLLKEEAAKADKTSSQEKQDFISTMGRYWGSEQTEIDKLMGDNDPANDWKIPWLDAQRVERETAAAAAAKTGAGGGPRPQTLSQLESDMNGIYSRNLDPYTGLTAAGKQALYNYASTYGGQYAGQLLAMYGLTGYQPQGAPPAGNTINPDQLVSSLSTPGWTQNDIENMLTNYLHTGQLTEPQVQYILGKLGYK